MSFMSSLFFHRHSIFSLGCVVDVRITTIGHNKIVPSCDLKNKPWSRGSLFTNDVSTSVSKLQNSDTTDYIRFLPPPSAWIKHFSKKCKHLRVGQVLMADFFFLFGQMERSRRSHTRRKCTPEVHEAVVASGRPQSRQPLILQNKNILKGTIPNVF